MFFTLFYHVTAKFRLKLTRTVLTDSSFCDSEYTCSVTAMSSRESREDKKKKKEKEREAEKFDNNIDADVINGSSSDNQRASSSSSSSGHASTSGTSADANKLTTAGKSSLSSEIQKLGKVFEMGFQNVSTTISHKLDKVGEKLDKGLGTLQGNLEKKLDDLANDPPNDLDLDREVSDDGGTWDTRSDFSLEREDRQSDHNMSVSDNEKKDSYFKKKNKPPPEEKTGDNVDADLAEISDRSVEKPITEVQFKEQLKEKYLRPGNVKWLSVPDIPYNIYRRLSSDFKEKDKVLKNIQEQLLPVGNSLVCALDKLGSGDLDGGLETLSDTLKGFGYVFRSTLTDKRRSLLKPKLPEDYKVLVTDKCPPTPTNLLGDISENTKRASETDKITTQMDKTSKPARDKNFKPRGKPYDRASNSSSSSRYSRKSNFFSKRYDGRRSYNKDNNNNNNNNNNSYNSDGRQSFRKRGQNRK